MKTEVWRLGDSWNAKRLEEAIRYLKTGKLVIFPTETVYGVGALPENKAALEKIYELKGRPKEKQFAWHLSSAGHMKNLNLKKNSLFQKVAEKFLPGPLTALVLNEKNEKIGIRIPSDKRAQQLIEAAGGAVLATSANPSGAESACDGESVISYFDGQADLILDGGPTQLQGDSTVVDFTVEPFKILRTGVYSKLLDELEVLARSE